MRSSGNGKRKRRASAATKHHHDIISQLPDDILISIISRLTLREATATSILSTRWRYLSTYITRLSFPPFKEEYTYDNLEDIQTRRFPYYINTINHVLDSHKGGRVKEFRVHTYCLEGVNIEKWFEFALAKEVEIIDIGMEFVVYAKARRGHYSLQLVNLMRPIPSPALKYCLKEFSLSAIDVDDRDIELLLSNFHLLESLSITYSESLRNVSIVGHSTPKLKHLDISFAHNLELIEIDNAMNLVSLKCYRLPKTYSLILNNVPNLIEFSTNDQIGCTLADIWFRMPSSIRDQLQALKLHVNLFCALAYERTMLPELMSIKHLELQTALHMDDIFLLGLNCVIQACPSLEKLEIKMSWSIVPKLKVNEDKEIIWPTPKTKLSPNLKKMKLSGFLGTPVELKLAFSILKNANSLEELIVEACDETKRIRRLASDRARRHFHSNSYRLEVI